MKQPWLYQSISNTVEGGEGSRCNYPTRIDTYGRGCEHNCAYCYAKSLLSFRGLWDESNPAVTNMAQVRKAVDNLKHSPFRGPVRLGGMTDCFQPTKELKHRRTFEVIKYFNRVHLPYLIVTKSALVAAPEYMAIYDKRLTHIQISITSTDDDLALKYEKASRISERIAALEMLHKKGFDTTLRLSPFIPEFYDFKRLNRIKVEKCLVEFLRVNTWIKQWLAIDLSHYTHLSGAYWHLPMEEKVRALKLLKFVRMSVCEDVPEHFKYFQENFNYNPADCCMIK